MKYDVMLEQIANCYYNLGLERARLRDLSGAAELLKKSLTFDKYQKDARNLLGLIFFECGETADALVLASPVHYAGISGAMSAFCDRLFYASDGWANKPCACVVSARRAGTTAALDQLIKYPMISNMPVVSSQYWPMVHGARPKDVAQDEEGLQTMRQLARNLLWLLQCMAAGDAAGVPRPATETRKFTNFIR